MDTLQFVKPTIDFADEIMAFRQEMLEAKSSFDGCYSLKGDENPEDFVKHCANWSDLDRPANRRGTWGDVVLAIRESDGKVIGSYQVHKILGERNRLYTGHVGYAVRPSERKKGYAKQLLSEAKKHLQRFGFDEIYVACLSENEASRRTILANGGEYVETVWLEEDGVELERYKINF